jgi:hypothetical protein
MFSEELLLNRATVDCVRDTHGRQLRQSCFVVCEEIQPELLESGLEPLTGPGVA